MAKSTTSSKLFQKVQQPRGQPRRRVGPPVGFYPYVNVAEVKYPHGAPRQPKVTHRRPGGVPRPGQAQLPQLAPFRQSAALTLKYPFRDLPCVVSGRGKVAFGDTLKDVERLQGGGGHALQAQYDALGLFRYRQYRSAAL